MKKILKMSSFALLLVALLTLTSCVPSADKAKEKMSDKGYCSLDTKSILGNDNSKIENVFYFAKGDNAIVAAANVLTGGDWVIAIYYKETADAKESYEEYKESKEDEKTAVKRSGKCIYYGTEQGLKDFK